MTDAIKKLGAELEASGMRCNCDLDNWQPNQSTGHSDVCRIHKIAIARARGEVKVSAVDFGAPLDS